MESRVSYYKYSTYLKNTYGEKVYKIPVNINCGCPNRTNGEGCIFCGEDGAGHESRAIDFNKQINENISYIGKKYNAKKFIIYFQNYTNTFLPITNFEKYLHQCIRDDVVEIAISTRPDCISKEYLDVMKKIENKYNVNITVELGLQTTNYHTLLKINRGHGLSEFVQAILLIKKYKFKICTHLILNLPWDNIYDTIESSKFVSALGVDFIKLHSLYIVKNTKLATMYLNNEIEICSKDEYVKRVITFLEYLDPNIPVQRLLGRAPEDISLFENWGMSWRKINDEIEFIMKNESIFQGNKFNIGG
ncbi:MAG: TIGR01212 family radical SAM protein [Lachnospirales bacterium]